MRQKVIVKVIAFRNKTETILQNQQNVSTFGRKLTPSFFLNDINFLK